MEPFDTDSTYPVVRADVDEEEANNNNNNNNNNSCLKRKHSKFGCVECKRRKIKCDETKPYCWQCSHLNKNCVYLTLEQQNFLKKKKKIEKKQRQKLKAEANDKLDFICNINKEEEEEEEEEEEKEGKEEKKYQTLEPPYNDAINIETSNENDIKQSLLDSIIWDANQLTADLIQELLLSDIAIPQLDLTQTLQDNSISDNCAPSTRWDDIRAKLVFFNSDLELYYLEVFYHKISCWILPLVNSPDNNISNKLLFNEIIENAKRPSLRSSYSSSSYLRYAMIAMAAKYLFNITSLENHKIIKEKYLKMCVLTLSAEFDSTSNTDNLISEKIRSLILCILLLAMDSSSNRIDWQVHLRGAKDIFFKYLKINSQTAGIQTLETLALSKSWFAAIEIVALLTTNYQGSNDSNAELDEMLNVGSFSPNAEILYKMNLLTDNGYNVFLGVSTEYIEFSKNVIKFRGSKDQKDPYSDHFLLICSMVQSCRDFNLIPNNFGKLIEQDYIKSFNECKNLDSIYLQSIIRVKGEYYSFYDVVQQIHVEALFKTYLDTLNLKDTILQDKSMDRLHKFIDWGFESDDETIKYHFIIEDIKNAKVSTYDDLKIDMSDLITEELRVDCFKLMMWHFALVLFSLNLSDKDVAKKCKMLAYFQVLAKNCGAESAKHSVGLLLNKWYNGKVSNSGVLPFS
ncbi:uncharacterized protein SCODWIG_00212 [Saccharomycodes ludwigii]|uniref:Zn(2)-C6 fungal-type domain-containing protein n=1 Tax=Saccharomycodes ludwigii TaxID=36035 RepID=A0A376B1D5_9ASCO|nr:hypothetical protein SCDLUD_001387 [Saccharomycodes ludwigii]KAH3901621.1 hypothetical protein SCDLUD_001387 [Saccharomycodes ludwigii]SSD58451.1 uncharacterized protein SCODWIG_00212 [Saccharomycodes ludwigii]